MAGGSEQFGRDGKDLVALPAASAGSRTISPMPESDKKPKQSNGSLLAFAWIREESAIFDTGAGIVIAIDQLTDEQFDRQALELLKRELGPDGLARFLRLNRSGPGDYTHDRDQWQRSLTLDQI